MRWSRCCGRRSSSARDRRDKGWHKRRRVWRCSCTILRFHSAAHKDSLSCQRTHENTGAHWATFGVQHRPKGGRNGTLGAKQLLEPCNTGSKMVEQISDMPGRFVPHTPHHHILLLKLHPRVREHLHFRFIYPDTKPTQANTYRNGTYGPTCFLGNAWWHCTEPGSLKCHAVSSGAA